MSTLILWIRHAESCSNAVEKIELANPGYLGDILAKVQKGTLGKTREPVLSPKGVLEAYFMGRCLADFFSNPEYLGKFNISEPLPPRSKFNFYCSFLIRTMITMKIISECFKKKLPGISNNVINRLCYISEKLNPVEQTSINKGAMYHGSQNITTHLKTKAHEHFLNTHPSINNIGYPINTEIIGPCCDFRPDSDTLCYSQPTDYNNFVELTRRLEQHFEPNNVNLIVSHGKYIHDNVHLHLLDSTLFILNQSLHKIFHETNGYISSCEVFFEKLDLFFKTNPQTQYTIDDFFIKLCEDVILVQSTPDNIKTSQSDIINAVKFRLTAGVEAKKKAEFAWCDSSYIHQEHHGIYNTEGLLCEYLPSRLVRLKVIFEPGYLSDTPPAAGGEESIFNRKYIVFDNIRDIRSSYTEFINRSLPIYNCVNPIQGYETTAKTFGLEPPKFIFQTPDSPGITFTEFLDYFDQTIDLESVYKQPIELYKKTKAGKDMLVASGTVAGSALATGLGSTVAAGSAAFSALASTSAASGTARAASDAAAGASRYFSSFFR